VCRISAKIGADIPEKAADYLLENNLPGEVLNSYDFGSYLIYRFYPERKVYVDGRIAMYGEELIKGLLMVSDQKMDRIIEKYGINTAFISTNEPERLHSYFIEHFKLTYSDEYARIYTR
ncbi:unnamed protein product, partial [marine sediment metagenome]